MNSVARVILTTLFTVLLSLLIILITLRFELLNFDFVTSSLQRGQVYESVPKVLKKEFGDILSKVTPGLTKLVVEKNLQDLINFVDGKTDKLSVYLPLKQLGFPVGIGFAGDEILLEGFTGGSRSPGIELLNDLGSYLWVALAVVSLLIPAVLFALYKVSHSLKLIGTMLLVDGLWIAIPALLTKLTISTTVSEWEKSTEPSHRLMALLAPTLLSDILTTWMILGGVVALIGVSLLIYSKFIANKPKSGDPLPIS